MTIRRLSSLVLLGFLAVPCSSIADITAEDSFMDLPPEPLDIPYSIPFEDRFNQMVEEADAAIREGNWKEAARVLENMILQNAGSLPVYVALVQVYRQLDQEEHAQIIAEEITRQLNAQGRGNDAAAFAREPEDGRVEQIRAIMSRTHRNQALRLRKEFATIYQIKAMRTGELNDLLRSAVLYAGAGATNESERTFTQAIELFPKADQPFQGLAMIAAGRGELQKAIEWLERARAVRPDNPDTYSNLAVLFIQQGDTDKAMPLLREALTLDPNHRYALQSLTALLIKQGNMREAYQACENALKANPKSSVAHNRIAEIYLRDKKWDKVASHLKTALESYPSIEGANFYLGMYEESLGHEELARDHYQRELKFNPYYVPALNNLGWLLAKAKKAELRDPKQAVDLARRACELTSYRRLILVDTLIHALIANDQQSEAIQYVVQAIDLAKATDKPAEVERLQQLQKELEAK